MKGLATFLAILLSTLALLLGAAAQPWPVEASIQPSLPYPGRTFEYRVRVSASRALDVVVRAAVHVPGVGWTEWRELWRGYMGPAEVKVITGSVEVPVDAVPGCVVVWVSVLFASPEDYQVIGGVRYYNSREFIEVVTVTGPWDESLRGLYRACMANLTALQGNLTKLVEERAALEARVSELAEENLRLKALCASLEELARKLETVGGQVRNLTLLLPVTALASAAIGALLAYLVVGRRLPKARPPPPPPAPP